jgi:excisionase family DNA binding protein
MDRKNSEKTEKQFHSVGEVAAVLDICPRTIYRAVSAGKIRAIRCGVSVLIPAVELQRICAKGF